MGFSRSPSGAGGPAAALGTRWLRSWIGYINEIRAGGLKPSFCLGARAGGGQAEDAFAGEILLKETSALLPSSGAKPRGGGEHLG